MKVKRREMMKSYILEKGEVHLKELEKLFPNVSSMTLRRDLDYLEEKGYVIRTRGGAKSIQSLTGIREPEYSLRMTENIDAKMKIAHKAVKYVEPGRSIFLDAGSSMMCLAKVLPDENFSIILSAPNIALKIIENHNPTVTLIGGQINRNNIATSGMDSINFLENINIDIAFVATSGFALDIGFTCGDFNECELKKFVINKARKVIMLVDAKKLERMMPFTFATLKDIDILISDGAFPDDVIKAIEQKGVKIE